MPAQEEQKESWSFTKWYEAHGDELNKQRKGKYQTDPKYRERVLQLNRASRERRRTAASKEKSEEKQAVKIATPTKHWKEEVSGEKTYFSIGALASILGKSVQAVRIWEEQHVLPKAKHRNKKGDRLYTAKELASIREKLLSKGLIVEGIRLRSEVRTRTMSLHLADGSVREEQVFGI